MERCSSEAKASTFFKLPAVGAVGVVAAEAAEEPAAAAAATPPQRGNMFSRYNFAYSNNATLPQFIGLANLDYARNSSPPPLEN